MKEENSVAVMCCVFAAVRSSGGTLRRLDLNLLTSSKYRWSQLSASHWWSKCFIWTSSIILKPLTL